MWERPLVELFSYLFHLIPKLCSDYWKIMPIRRLYVKYIGFIDVICFYFIPYLNYFPYFLLNIEKIDKGIEFFYLRRLIIYISIILKYKEGHRNQMNVKIKLNYNIVVKLFISLLKQVTQLQQFCNYCVYIIIITLINLMLCIISQ